MTFRTAGSIAALAITLGLTAQGLAQSNPPAPGPKPNAGQAAPQAAPKTPVAGQIMMQEANTILASRDLIGQTVYAPDDAKIGSISDLIVSKDGKSIHGFVIGVGGFLGIGERNVALQMDKLKIAAAPDGSTKLTMDMKREELANAPAFKSLRDAEAEKKRSEAPAPRPVTPRN
jgi:hypothetical protein